MTATQQAFGANDSTAQFQQIYDSWDQALSSNDTEALLALYAPDATLESPLVAHFVSTGKGILKGHHELRAFFELLAKRNPALRGHYRTAFLTDGKNKMIFEYPRWTGERGHEQFDIVEVMELRDGLIHYHRAYWGWFALRTLQQDSNRT